MVTHLLELRQGEAFEQTYYLLLLVAAVAVAFAIFGTMQAIATVSGKYLGLHFRVGGPAAGALLVVVGGYYWQSL